MKKEATTQFVTAASCSDLHVRSPAEDLTPRILPCPMEFHCLFCRILTSPAEPHQTGHGIIRLNCCTISFNLAPSVTQYQLVEILISAGPRFECDIQYFRQVGCKFCVRSLQIVHCQLNYIHYLHNVLKHNRQATGIFLYF